MKIFQVVTAASVASLIAIAAAFFPTRANSQGFINGSPAASGNGTGNITGSGMTSKGVVLGGGGQNIVIGPLPGTVGNVLQSDGTNWISGPASGGNGTGNVTGPGSSTANAIATWNGTSGTALKNSGITIDASDNIITSGNVTGNRFSFTSGNVTDLNVTGNVNITNTLTVSVGGTGFSTSAKGTLLIGNNATTLGQLGIGSNGQVLMANSSATYGANWANVTSGSGGDNVSPLLYSEISITGATTLGSGAFGNYHVISGSTDYTITLPAVSGNAGKFIAFRCAPAYGKVITLDGNSSETIDGATTQKLWANESATLYCDGTTWTKTAGKTLPMRVRFYAASNATVSTATWTEAALDTTANFKAPAAFVNTGSSRIEVLRAGNYSVVGQMYLSTAVGTIPAIGQIRVNGSDAGKSLVALTNGADAPVFTVANLELAAGDYIEYFAIHFNSSDMTAGSGQFSTYLSVTEIPTW